MTIYTEPSSHLFTMRLWIESVGGGKREVRYQVKHILSGETRYFRDWYALATFLLEKSIVEKSESGERQDAE